MKTDFNKFSKEQLVSFLQNVESMLDRAIPEAEKATVEYSLSYSQCESVTDPTYRTCYPFQAGFLKASIQSASEYLKQPY